MPLFAPENRDRSERSRRFWAAFELAYTMIDFGAAICFIIGSMLFFYASLMTVGTWFFLVGSIMFAAKPALTFGCEIKPAAIGDTRDLAKRFDE